MARHRTVAWNRFACAVAAVGFLLLAARATLAEQAVRRPNVILILADDLGYGELGCYGQKKIHTPQIDRLASEGMRFTQHYSAAPVCAPTRCSLMTGLHGGHAFIRDNLELKKQEGQQPIPADSVTVARLLKGAGYTTACVGKWGLGPIGSTGDPNAQGFDLFYGYSCQRQAHNYRPDHLWRNQEKVPLDGKAYSPDLIEAEALSFIRTSKDKPFFLYFASTLPHVSLDAPAEFEQPYLGQWKETPFTGGGGGYAKSLHPRATYAAMITRLDATVGRIAALLKELKLDRNTVILFASDNGATHDAGGVDSKFFDSVGPLQGRKGSVYEGGIRVPLIAWAPGRVKPNTVSDLPCTSYDFLPTLCDLAGAKLPQRTDGMSIVPTLLGQAQPPRAFLYWDFGGYGGQQAVRLGDWMGLRRQLNKGRTQIELYDLKHDLSEKQDVATKHPDVVARIAAIMKEQHEPSSVFPMPVLDTPALDGPKAKK